LKIKNIENSVLKVKVQKKEDRVSLPRLFATFSVTPAQGGGMLD
jgi:hypothetical protein